MQDTLTGRLRRIAAVWAALAVVPAALMAAVQEPADLSGDWALEVTTEAGVTTPSVTLEQDGTMLTGHYSSEALGEQDVTGSVEGADFHFDFDAELQGQSFRVTYTGTLQEDGTISGELDLGGFAGADFTGTKR